MIKSLCFIFTIGFTLSLAAQSQLIDKVVAKVGSEYILLSEIEEEFSYAESRNPNVSNSIKCDILDNIIAQKLVIYHAKIDSVEITDAEVDQLLDFRFESVLRQMNGDEATHTIAMTASGPSDEESPPIVTYDHLAELPSAAFGGRWRWSFHSFYCMRSIYAALVLSFSTAVAAQPLRPCVPEVFPEYYRALEDVITRAVPAASELSILLMPSLSPERAVRLREEQGRFTVYSMELSSCLIQSSIRDIPSVGRTFDSNQPSIQATISQATLPSGLARRVLTVFRDAVAQSEPGRDLVMDGTSYRIEISGRCAEAFSPEPESESG